MQQVFKKVYRIGAPCLTAAVVVAVLGGLVSMTVSILMDWLLLIVKYCFSLLCLVGETMKSNMFLLAIWILILAISSKISITEIIYRSIISIIGQEEQCEISLQSNSTFITPCCGHFYHKHCLDGWIAHDPVNHVRCPYNCAELPIKNNQIIRRVNPMLIDCFYRQRKGLFILIAVGWAFLTLFFIAI